MEKLEPQTSSVEELKEQEGKEKLRKKQVLQISNVTWISLSDRNINIALENWTLTSSWSSLTTFNAGKTVYTV